MGLKLVHQVWCSISCDICGATTSTWEEVTYSDDEGTHHDDDYDLHQATRQGWRLPCLPGGQDLWTCQPCTAAILALQIERAEREGKL